MLAKRGRPGGTKAALPIPLTIWRFTGNLFSTTWHPVYANLPDFPQITKYTYWTMPLYPATCGLVLRLRLLDFVMQMYSSVWGPSFILAFYGLAWSITKVHPVALASAALTAVDTVFILDATDGRRHWISADWLPTRCCVKEISGLLYSYRGCLSRCPR
jgi:hypothetical protein